VHVYQLVASLLIFGIAAHEFNVWQQLFLDDFQSLHVVEEFGNLKPAGQREEFAQLWLKALVRLSPDFSVTTSFESVIALMFTKDSSLLIQVMNFLMSTCELTNPRVSSAIALWAGDVLMQLEVYDSDAHLSQLYFSALLTFGPLFDYLTCVSSLNSISKILRKQTVTPTTFPDVYASRILQVLLRRSSVGEPDVVDAVCICARQFCATFKDGLTEPLCAFMLDALIALLRHERFGRPADAVAVIGALLRCDLPAAFARRFALLARITLYHPAAAGRIAEAAVDAGPEAEAAAILGAFLGGAPWMACAAAAFVRELLPGLAPALAPQLTALLDSPADEVAAAVQTVVPLIFVNA
jgi:hypothetical protein